MEENIKMLPVKTDSVSKGYITYNPAKFDIIPVGKAAGITSQPVVESGPITEAPVRSGKHCELPVKLNSSPIVTNVVKDFRAITSCEQPLKVTNSQFYRACEQPISRGARMNYGSFSRDFLPQPDMNFGPFRPNQLYPSARAPFTTAYRHLQPPFSCANDLRMLNNPINSLSGVPSAVPLGFEQARTARAQKGTYLQHACKMALPNAVFGTTEHPMMIMEGSFVNPLRAMQSVVNSCEPAATPFNGMFTNGALGSLQTDDHNVSPTAGASIAAVFKDIQTMLNCDSTTAEEDGRTYETHSQMNAPERYACAKGTGRSSGGDQAGDGPFAGTSLKDIQSIFSEGSYKHIQSGLSDGEHTDNSNDNFEMVYVKCEPTEGFYPENIVCLDERRRKTNARRRTERESETDEQRQKRLIQIRDAARFRRSSETDEQRRERLRKDREKKRKYREEMKQDITYKEILEKNRIVMRKRRENEFYREKERERDRIRHQVKRSNAEFRMKEKIKERERKRMSRFLKKYAQKHMFDMRPMLDESILYKSENMCEGPFP